MVTPEESPPGSSRGHRLGADVTGRPVWRLLLRGLGVFLPGWRAPQGVTGVRDGASGFGPPGYVDGAAGFGLYLADRARGLEPDREIYVRGRQDPSFGIVIAGPSAAIGTRVVDAAGLVRYARRLTFEELYDAADAGSVPYAVRAARAVHNVVLLDRAAGVGLCAEADPVTGRAACPLFVRLRASNRTVRAYGLGPAVTTPRPTG
ncbi:hypothetical protein Acsp04_14870 [Actinomadura sp. NBRC 104425]|uniref:hypothetical protein n=1 Tax=Actinomadura sp. NBRC 104425 TaxID=3032204 RepID=UPI0024A58E32|nr:hypothetical protein [Actinomadura sp. NBRC 104425]GLZ11252.1 hypothetical protein Acsp04_14870 [Actinomadura sp. NBRC 104425]